MALIALVAAGAACTREEILPGERIGLRDVFTGGADSAAQTPPENRAEPISLPAPVTYTAWTHRAGEPDHALVQPAFSSAPQVLWSVKIGQGNDRKHRITADPVAANGAVFVMDSRSLVSAISTAGAVLWQRDLTPPTERADDATGGGLAVANGTLFVSTGFGTLSALDASSGAVLWTQKLDAPVSGAPTVVDGQVFVVSKDNRGLALDAGTGRINWEIDATPKASGIVGASSPAVAGDTVLFPFSSGELVAAQRQSGVQKWNVVVAGRRPGRGYSLITDITGEPVVKAGVVYAGNAVGRTIATSLQDGKRLWSAPDGATGPVWVSGGSVFLISDEAKLVRLDARNGSRIWAVDLPYFTQERARRRKAIYANFGPVLAGGLLWVASSDGQMRAFNPEDGALVRSVALPAGAASRPAIVQGTAFLLDVQGRLVALR